MLTPRLLKKNKLYFIRKSTDGYWDDNGNWIEGTLGLPFSVDGNIQPYQMGKVRIDLPEGIKASDVKIFYTTTKLLTVDDYTNTEPDYTTIDNIEYVVFDVGDWSTPAYRSKNYKVILVRRDKLNGN